MVGLVFGGWIANIDVSQASQGLAGGRSFSEAKGSWGQTRGGNKLERMQRLLSRCGPLFHETAVVEKYLGSILFCALH